VTAQAVVDDALRSESRCRAPTGVSVVTTQVNETPIGMTASSVTALSLDPIQNFVCVGNHLFSRKAISDHGRFGVNILGDDSHHLAKKFASAGDRFADVDYDVDQGVLMLRGPIAGLVCAVAARRPGGDHTIFVRSVRSLAHDPAQRLLVHCLGDLARTA